MSAERKLMGTTDATTAANYIEDVFSTYLYTGNGASQTINNGIDLSTKGGLVWLKSRSAATDHALYDTARGVTLDLVSNSTAAQTTQATGLTAFGSTGFSIGSLAKINTSTSTYASWTFREQAKFFDVVTYTGNNAASRTISHNLGATPGMIIIKSTGIAENSCVYHRSTGFSQYLSLSSTSAAITANRVTATTANDFTIAYNTETNSSTSSYVAYLFAHNAGGFGASGTDNVISCGSFTGAGAGQIRTVTLGWEPQFVMAKRTDAAQNWLMFDNMRGLPVGTGTAILYPNLSNAETGNQNSGGWITPTATGFTYGPDNYMGDTANIIYLAIRRGPMRTPTSGASVFGLNARTGTGANVTVTGGQIADTVLIKNRGSAVADILSARLTSTGYLATSATTAETAAGTTILQANPWDVMDGVKVGTTSTTTNASSNTFINYLFRRAPGFFDVVCYTGTGTATTVTHNLGVAPELIIVKGRSGAGGGMNWGTYAAPLGANKYFNLNDGQEAYTNVNTWNNTSPTSSVFSIGPNGVASTSGMPYVAYLFASCPGVSKVGSYTGTGAAQTIDCGFTAGARFVLIKRTDSAGGWYTYDTARGMVTGTDPYLLINTTDAEVNANYVFTSSTGFTIQAAAPAGINGSGGTFIYLAIA